MADNYDKLTDAEAAYWDVYTRLREISDWAGFTDGQKQAKDTARAWLVAQRKEIWRSAQPAPDGDGKGWDVNQRRERYNQLEDSSLDGGSCRRLCQLPVNGETDTEKAKTTEREMWWRVSSVDDQTKTWRENNVAWLTDRRKQVWHLMQEDATAANREVRYDNLCVATKTGKAYEEWAADHNTDTGAENPPEPVTPDKPDRPVSARARAIANARKYLGVSENPAGSNRGDPQPSEWQRRVYGSAGVPWCACFTTCMAWDAGVKGAGSAGVAVIVSMAQKGQGMFRGYTTDPSKVLQGDMAIVGCTSCHVALVASSDDACHTVEGNTSPSTAGSQYNGGCVAEKHRPRGDIVGWALVDYP